MQAPFPVLPYPPPADVIVEKIELDPLFPTAFSPETPAPPAPTVIGKPVAVTVILFPGVL